MSKKKPPKTQAPKPRLVAEPRSLPGMEDREIAELHKAAMVYAAIRDKRMVLNEQEITLKAALLGMMKKHKKETYKYNGVEIFIVHEEENVKVRVHKKEDEDEAA